MAEPDGADLILVVLGGEPPSETLARSLGARASRIVCADSGAEFARSTVMHVDAIVGDLDSITAETLALYRAGGTEIVLARDQELDDFEKTLEYVASFYAGPVAVLGMTGRRSDHALTNLSVMLRMTDRFDQLVAYDDHASYRFLSKTRKSITLACPIGTLVSLIPFGEARQVTTTNLQYPLSGEDLSLGARVGLSNVATGTPVSVEIGTGALLVSMGHAEAQSATLSL